MKLYYVVARGHSTGLLKANGEPGFYEKNVLPLVHGYKGALYKGFDDEQEALTWLENNRPQPVVRGGVVCYVDGGNSSRGDRIAWAFLVAVEDEEGRILETLDLKGGLVPMDLLDEKAKQSRNVLGELYAARRAMEYIDECALGRDKPVLLFHDYEGVGAFANGWKARYDFVRDYVAVATVMKPYIQFVKIAGHSGIEGNEIVDKLCTKYLKQE